MLLGPQTCITCRQCALQMMMEELKKSKDPADEQRVFERIRERMQRPAGAGGGHGGSTAPPAVRCCMLSSHRPRVLQRLSLLALSMSVTVLTWQT